MRNIFFDVDTQFDFILPAGALAVPGAPDIVPALRALKALAVRERIPIISTADAHLENDVEFEIWKPHCVMGTQGQTKISDTVMAGQIKLGHGTLHDAPQIIVEKTRIDPFSNPNLERLLAELGARSFTVYGVATEHCVNAALKGLLERGYRVTLVSEAVAGLDRKQIDDVLTEFRGRGGIVTSLAELELEEGSRIA